VKRRISKLLRTGSVKGLAAVRKCEILRFARNDKRRFNKKPGGRQAFRVLLFRNYY
jgi:hypothetical protein